MPDRPAPIIMTSKCSVECSFDTTTTSKGSEHRAVSCAGTAAPSGTHVRQAHRVRGRKLPTSAARLQSSLKRPCLVQQPGPIECLQFRPHPAGLARGLSLPLDDRINKTLPPVRSGQLGGSCLDLGPSLAVVIDPFDKSVEMHGGQPKPLCQYRGNRSIEPPGKGRILFYQPINCSFVDNP